MMISASNSILALLLAVMLLFQPAILGDAVRQEQLPAFTVTVEDTNDDHLTAGFARTADGAPAVLVERPNRHLIVTGDGAGYTDKGTSYFYSAEELQPLLTLLTEGLPQPDRQDTLALIALLQGLYRNLSEKALQIDFLADGYTVTVDIDELCLEVKTAIPETLAADAAYFDPVLSKYVSPLLGKTFTSADLIQLWQQIDFDNVSTGLTATVTVQQLPQGPYVTGRIGEIDFAFTMDDEALQLTGGTEGCTFTLTYTEEGLLAELVLDDHTYVLDTADFPLILQIAQEATQKITDASFGQDYEVQNLGGRNYVGITTYRLNTATLATELNYGLAHAISAHTAEVDALVKKYLSWLELWEPSFALDPSAATLMKVIMYKDLITLPEMTGELIISEYMAEERTTVEGRMENLHLSGEMIRDNVASGTFTLTVEDPYDPLRFTLSIAEQLHDCSITLSCNRPIFDLFSSLTVYSYISSWENELNITTDTDIVHFLFSDNDQHFELKVGPALLNLSVDENDVALLGLHLPSFFAELCVQEDTLRLNSSVLNLELCSATDQIMLEGYLCQPDGSDRISFGLSMDEHGTWLRAYLLGAGTNLSFHGVYGVYTLCIDDDPYTLMAHPASDNMVILHNDAVLYTILPSVTEDGDLVVIKLFEGAETTGEPLYTVTIDLAPDAVSLPAGAIPVDPETFTHHLESLFE